MTDQSESQMRLAEHALAVAAAATESAHDTRRHQAPQQGSGEFQAVLLSLVTELKTDSREHRQKLETVLIRLTMGDGRMERIERQGDATRDRLSAIESRIAVVERTGDDTRENIRKVELRLATIETGTSSGIQKAIHHAVAAAVVAKPTPEGVAAAKKDLGFGLSISTPVVLKIVASLVTVACAAVGGYFALRQTQVQSSAGSQAQTAPTSPPSPTPAQPATVKP